MIYELRVYHCLPGRLADLCRRFKEHTLRLWEGHGIRTIGFWTVVVGDNSNELLYLLQWDGLQEREQKWGAFMTSPAWAAVRAETEKNGPLFTHVSNTLLTPTDFSKLQ